MNDPSTIIPKQIFLPGNSTPIEGYIESWEHYIERSGGTVLMRPSLITHKMVKYFMDTFVDLVLTSYEPFTFFLTCQR